MINKNINEIINDLKVSLFKKASEVYYKIFNHQLFIKTEASGSVYQQRYFIFSSYFELQIHASIFVMESQYIRHHNSKNISSQHDSIILIPSRVYGFI